MDGKHCGTATLRRCDDRRLAIRVSRSGTGSDLAALPAGDPLATHALVPDKVEAISTGYVSLRSIRSELRHDLGSNEPFRSRGT